MSRKIAIGILAFAAITACLAGDRGGRLLLGWGMPSLAASVLQHPAWRGVALYQAGRFEEAERALRTTGSPEAAYNLGNAFVRNGNLAAAIKAYDIALKRDPNDADAQANRALVMAALKTMAAPPSGKVAGLADATATKEKTGENLAGDEAGLQSSSGDGMAGQREAGSDADSAGSSRVDRRGAPKAGKNEAGRSASKGAATDSAGRAGRSGGQTTVASSNAPPPTKTQAPAEPEMRQATLQWLTSLPDDPVRFLRLRIAAEHQRRVTAGTAVGQGGSAW